MLDEEDEGPQPFSLFEPRKSYTIQRCGPYRPSYTKTRVLCIFGSSDFDILSSCPSTYPFIMAYVLMLSLDIDEAKLINNRWYYWYKPHKQFHTSNSALP